MTKTLTEQWRDGTLNGGIYYLLLRDGTTVTDQTIYIVGEKQLRWHFSSFDFIKEVLAPVPSYDEYNQLKLCSDDLDKTTKVMIDAQNKWMETIKAKKKLQERLADADKALKAMDEKYGEHYTIADGTKMGNSPAWKYMLKWGVK